MTFFGAVSITGFLGALTFLLMFILHPSTKDSRRSRESRIFWLFIVADSAVMLMIYSLGLLNNFFPHYPYSAAIRIFIAVCAIAVIWWRVAMFWSLNMRRRKLATDETPEEGNERNVTA
jgi:hypothetical protein